jgi:hypothetical protein
MNLEPTGAPELTQVQAEVDAEELAATVEN